MSWSIKGRLASAWLVVALATLGSNGALAEGGEAPPSSGVGMLVSGIVLTSVGSGFAAINLLGVMVDECTDEDYDPNCASRHRAWGEQALAGLAVGLGAGIPLIVAGVRQHRIYKQYQAGESEPSWDLRLAPLPRGAVAMLTIGL